jgi:nucleoid-associated protein YgaU
MTNPAVHVSVTTEVGYCPFCRRTRNLRREERQLGGLVRTNIDCESCHRTISSTIGPPAPPAPEPVEAAAPPAAAPEAPAEPAAAKPRKAATRAPKAAAKKPAARKPASTRKTRA